MAVGLLAAGLVLGAPAGTVLATRYRAHAVGGSGMAPTLRPGSVVLTEPVPADTVQRGDLLLLDAPDDRAPGPVVLRLIGTGGDRVACCGAGGLRRNGALVAEPYALGGGREFGVQVNPHRLFVLGDNRTGALDSRVPELFGQGDGTLAEGAVLGRVVWASGSAVPAPGSGTATALVRVAAAGAVLFLLGLLGLPVALLAARRRC
ncbi:signal peptidase I [Kitasatospora sp. NPDC007106]|uniref:signal peptidase I n=1 Tax=Kitasatospora sp. NPDC007106 TaxID=3156914 RepID=UPI0033FFD2E9